MDLDDFEFHEVVLRDVWIKNTLMTYFDEGIFKRPDLQHDLYNHFCYDAEWAKIKATDKEQGVSYEEMMGDHLLEVYSFIL